MSFVSSAMLNLAKQQALQSRTVTLRCAHTVRIIVTEDLADGKRYAGDIVNVSAGYARNFLIPRKKAVYATRQNFAKLDIKDPDQETGEERRLRLEREAEAGDDQDLKAADLLKFYLRNKVLKIWRNVDNSTEYNAIAPGVLDAKAIRQKLSKQLMIDLEPHEKIHLLQEAVNHHEVRESELENYMKELGDRDTPCTTQIKHLGEYVARISLQGGYSIPLKVEVLKR